MPVNERNVTVLIVDDEPETLKGYADFLAPAAATPKRSSSRLSSAANSSGTPAINEPKYRLLLARSGEEAVQLAEAEIKNGDRVSAGFFDVKLEGGMDGLQTIQAIRALDPDIHCVVVTAYHDRTVDEIQQLFGEDFQDHWDYLNKPFTRGEIVQKARQMTAAWNNKRKIEVLNRQLVKSERFAAIGQVARGVGHEFGNILLRIMGKADLALVERDVAKIHEHLKVLLVAAERAGLIVRNLQSFSRTEPSFRMCNITTPMNESLSLVNHEFVKHSVTLSKDFKAVPEVKIDTGGLAQVFLNLIINAIHVLPKGGKIHVAVEKVKDDSGHYVAARVADNGPGIAPEVLPRIFDYAFSTKGDRGSGLGLSISKEIVEAQGGRIEVKTSLGGGTEFTVLIPVSSEREEV